MVNEVPEEFREVWSTLTWCISYHWGKDQSLAEVVIIIYVSLRDVHYPNIVRFDAVHHVVCVTDGDVHSEFGWLWNRDLVGLGALDSIYRRTGVLLLNGHGISPEGSQQQFGESSTVFSHVFQKGTVIEDVSPHFTAPMV